MGRRKIEIQPITHERNRSVTFLKRKNGLFKKAYELGVLCSVDVAVIIFEERPGHHVKLYQYCSGDVDAMVQRHLHFEGERDLKTPADFSNNKNDEAADDDEDAEEDDASRVKKEKSTPQNNVKPSSSHTSGGTHGNIPIRPAQSTPQDPSRSSFDMNFRGGSSSRMGSGSQMNGVPVLPVSNERNMNPSRAGSMSLPSAGISMPLSLPIPPIGQQAQKRPRVDTPLAPPPGMTYPYRLNVDLNTYPPTAHAQSLSSQLSPQQQRHPQGDIGLPFPSNVGMSMDAFSSSSGFEFPSSRPRPSLGFSAPGQQGGGAFGGVGGMNGVFGSRPGPQTTNMLMDLLNSTAGAAPDVSPFEWPATSSQGAAPLDAGTVSNDWLEFLASSTTQQSPSSSSLPLGLPTPTTSRAASNSVSSTTSTRAPFGLPSASSSPHSLSPGRKRSRDETCFDSPGSGVLKAMKLGSDGRRSVG